MIVTSKPTKLVIHLDLLEQTDQSNQLLPAIQQLIILIDNATIKDKLVTGLTELS